MKIKTKKDNKKLKIILTHRQKTLHTHLKNTIPMFKTDKHTIGEKNFVQYYTKLIFPHFEFHFSSIMTMQWGRKVVIIVQE